MKRQAKPRSVPPPAGPSPKDTGVPTLPAWKAFVVQFSQETVAHTENFAGRVEHLSSGRRAGFRSRQELLAVLERLLDELEDTSK